MKSFGERIADTLLADGLLNEEQLNEVLDLQKKQGGRLLKLLLEKQLVTEQDMMVSMGRCLGAQPVTLAKMRVPQDVIDLIPKDLAQTYKMVAVARLGRKLFGDGGPAQRARPGRSAAGPAQRTNHPADQH